MFKRINFFEGQIRTLQDYWDQVGYKVDKRALHHRAFHQYGVVGGVGAELRVRQRRVPELAVEVRPGFAVDPQGRDILLREVEVKRLSTSGVSLPCTLHLVARYRAEETDRRRIQIPGFAECEGDTRIVETYALDWTLAEPNQDEVELCRILLTDDVRGVTDAVDPDNPGPGEVDLRHVPFAGWDGGSIREVSWPMLRGTLKYAIRTHQHLSRSRNLTSSAGLACGFATMAIVNEVGMIDEQAMLRSLGVLHTLQRQLVVDIREGEPLLARRTALRKYQKLWDDVGDLVESAAALDPKDRAEAVARAVHALIEAERLLTDLVQPPRLSAVQGELEAGTGIRVLDGTEWEKLKIESQMPLRRVVVEGREWRLVDELDLLDPESERRHHFVIREALDFWRNQVTLKYPDGVRVHDAGIAHQGGFAAWEVHNLTPGMPLVIVRRTDYGRGDYWCRVWVGDVEAGEVPCHGQDTRYRWRNWPFGIEGHFVRHGVMRVRQSIETANRDVNYFRLWFYQPV